MARCRSFRPTPPVFEIATGCAALDKPITIPPKGIAGGCTESCGGARPTPLSGTRAAATPVVDVETTSVAALPPVAAGVKTTCAVQLSPLASLPPQVVDLTAKLVVLWPTT